MTSAHLSLESVGDGQRYLHSHPVVISRIPFLLERDDPAGRSLALSIAITATDQPELLTALRDFALSQNEPDEQRHRAAQVVQEAGLLPAGPVRMWLGGQWQEISFMSFEIHTDLSYWRQRIAFADQPRLGDWRKLLGF